MPGDELEDIRDALQYLDFFIPSLAEAQELTGWMEAEAISEVFKDMGAKNIVIKMGAQGCYLNTEDYSGMTSGYCVESVVDTTGCGDNFVAGFITGLVQDFPTYKCAQLANAAGAINATKLGSNGAVYSYEQLINFIRQNEERKGNRI